MEKHRDTRTQRDRDGERGGERESERARERERERERERGNVYKENVGWTESVRMKQKLFECGGTFWVMLSSGASLLNRALGSLDLFWDTTGGVECSAT